jgi:ankyrin repeat protein
MNSEELHCIGRRPEDRWCVRKPPLDHAATDRVLQNKYGKTRLRKTVINPHDDIVKLFLQNNDICHHADTTDSGRRTVLHWAAEYGNEKAVRMLTEEESIKGRIFDFEDNGLNTAIHRAAQNGYNRIVEKLFKRGANVSIKNTKGHTVLHSTIEKCDKELAIYLLKNKVIDHEDGKMARKLADKYPDTGYELLRCPF